MGAAIVMAGGRGAAAGAKGCAVIVVFALLATASCKHGSGSAPFDAGNSGNSGNNGRTDTRPATEAGSDRPSSDTPVDLRADLRVDLRVDLPTTDAPAGDLPVSDAARVDGAPGREVIDSTSLKAKMLFGYQGWFAARGDGSQVNSWHHWLSLNGTELRFQVDNWPDLSELDPDERMAVPGLSFPDGMAAAVYSAFKEKTVVRHFRWMREHDLDGVLLQRFLGEIQDPRFFAFRNQVTRNVRAGAEQHGRVFAIEYDLSLPQAMQPMIVDALKRDWMYLVDTLKVTESDRYLRERGKPVLAIWGFGFNNRPTTPAQAQEIINWFRSGAPAQYQAVVIGGVPSGWRTLTGASQTDPAWAPVYRSFDVVSPWAVGGFIDDAGADRYAAVVAADMVETKAAGIGYLPVMFPGFSWHNLKGDAVTNQIPRRGGRFYWRQATNLVKAGATAIKTAMFDEVDEGTAMFKLARTKAEAPAQAPFVTLDADGEALSADFYLRLARAATSLVRGERTPSAEVPVPAGN